jgi:hypothetical protein
MDQELGHQKVWIRRRTLWELRYLVGGNLAQALPGCLDRGIKTFGKPIRRLTEVEIDKA